MIGLGVTGTDTGVGKTVVSCALLALALERGLRVAAMKPLETGVSRGDAGSDGARLRNAVGNRHTLDDISPYVLPEPLAPLAAARRAGQAIDLAVLDAAFARLSAASDLIVVEGAGGLMVPITEREGFDTLFHRWELALVIVAANRLGAINHILLTYDRAVRIGLSVRGVVLTELGERAGSAPANLAAETNFELLDGLLPSVSIYKFPFVPRTDDLAALAVAGRQAGLAQLIAPG